MKKLKMPLTALAIFALVGGALAFKSPKFAQGNLYCLTGSTLIPANSCASQATQQNFFVNGTGPFTAAQICGTKTPVTPNGSGCQTTTPSGLVTQE